MEKETNITITPLTGLKGAYRCKEDDISIVAYYIPRSLIANGVKFPYKELSYSGIYFLCGQKNYTEKIYVGQASTRNDGTSIISRLREHDKNIKEHYHDTWDCAIAVTSTEGSWDRADISGLEQKFEKMIPQENCLNSVKPSSGGSDTLKTDKRAECIRHYLVYMGIKLFEDDSTVGGTITEGYFDTNGNVEDIRGGTSKIPEIITPTKIVKRMILELKPETWNSNTKFIDLACKGGEYLREIYEQLMKNDNLIADYPDPTSRSVHILKNQIYGIALGQTSKERTKKKLFGFNNNILIIPEYIVNIKDQNKRSDLIKKIKQMFGDLDMKFDVVIGNPPYSEETKAGKNGSVAIWNSFVETAIEVKPRCICMITPSRYFTGGMGLQKFRGDWLSDSRIAKLVHFPIAEQVFPGTEIVGGVSYFIWDATKKNKETLFKNAETQECWNKAMDTFDVLLVDLAADRIASTVTKHIKESICKNIKGNRYGIDKNWRGTKGKYSVVTSGGMYRCGEEDIKEKPDGYRVIVSNIMSEHCGKPSKSGKYKTLCKVLVIDEDTVCTASYVCIAKFKSFHEAQNCVKYIKTKFVRELIRLRAVGININRNAYEWVPNQDFTSESKIDWTRSVAEIDKQLYRMYNLNEEEIGYIENTMQAIE